MYYNDIQHLNKKLEGENLEKFKSLTGLNHCPTRGFERVKSFYDIANNYFFLHKTCEDKYGIIEMDKIVGSTYLDDYRGEFWWYFRINLRRKLIKTIEQANDAIDNSLQEDSPFFYKIGNEILIVSGHHRICISKFGGRKKIKAKYKEFFFDQKLYNNYEYLINYFNINLNYTNTYLKPNELEAYWDLENENFKIRLNNRKHIEEFINFFKILKNTPLKLKLFMFLNQSDFNKTFKYYFWTNNNKHVENMIKYESMLIKYRNKL